MGLFARSPESMLDFPFTCYFSRINGEECKDEGSLREEQKSGFITCQPANYEIETLQFQRFNVDAYYWNLSSKTVIHRTPGYGAVHQKGTRGFHHYERARA